jgi:nucleoside-diphosphate-sugar epimerase
VPTIREVAMIEHKEISKEDIAQRAYEIYVQRGEEPGNAVEDWARAEKELGVEPVVTTEKTIAARLARTN